ncbi:hypothetical protein AA313_de0207952 [Arthrobotrys entomopaga]|nr:hypothetical protein AA313_de0207952 [Arthrobotrys entomopaga]
MASASTKSHDEYTVGWISALPKELAYAISMLDEKHPALDKSANDSNCYTLGSIGPHNVSIACLPKDWVGTSRATKVAAQMTSTFPNIKIILMVGIGAGIPSHVSLGDVVISTEWTQWDFGKTKDGIYEYVEKRCYPPDALLSVISKFEAEHIRQQAKASQYLERLKYQFPDLAFPRGALESLRVHYGLIASGNQVIKDANLRDSICRNLRDKVLCIEMEAAGLISFPAVIIRGICDFADSNKNDDWHEYAAFVAAAFAKQLLEYVPAISLENERTGKNLYNKAFSKSLLSRRGLDREEESKILRWLTDVDYHSRQNDHFNSRQPKTGEWLLNSVQYQEWLHTNQKILFCHGMPGAGKTVMTSVVVDHLETHYLNDLEIGIAYIYFNFKQTKEQEIDKLLLSLLKQLSLRQESVPNCVAELYQRHFWNETRPSRREITTSLASVAALYSRVFIIVDAVDECQSGDNRSTFLNELFRLRDHNANIFATSRPIFDIETDFKNADSIVLEIKASVEDVRRYLDGKINASGKTVMKRNRKDIISKISEMASGMFLLAYLYFESIKTKQSLGEINRSLENSRGGQTAYDQAYENALNRIRDTNDEYSRDLAFRTISWITCVTRPLKIAELLHGLAVEVDGIADNENEVDEANLLEVDDMLSLCTGLVKVDEETGIVRLVHYTTQEYLDRTWDRWFPDAHSNIAMACVAYMSYRTFESGQCLGYTPFYKRRNSYPLYQYAVENWAYHTRKSSPDAEKSLGNTPLASLVLKFVQNDGLRMSCVQARFWSEDPEGRFWYPEKMPEIPFVVHEGLLSAVTMLVDNGADMEAKDWNGRTALLWAAEDGHEATVRFLIDNGADLNAKDRYYDRTPFIWAAENGHEAIVRYLVDMGMDIEVKCRLGRTALTWAAKMDQLAVVRFLVDKGANTKVKDRLNETPLQLAAFYRSEAVVSFLENLV